MEIISKENTATNTHAVEFKFSAEEFEKAVSETYNKQKGRINIPGFRKGKAPRKVIEAHYGPTVFYEDAVETLYRKNIEQLIALLPDLEVVNIENPEVTKVDKVDGVTFKADIITKPEVTISDYKGLEVTKTVKTITDEDIDAEIDKMRSRGARIITVEDRAAQKGDTAVINFEGFLDGVAFEGGKGDSFPLELGSGTFIPGFEDQIVGKNIGEEFDVNVTFPEDYQSEELRGKPVVFKCKLLEIKAKELPELDDEFVKDISDKDTVDELKADIRERLEKQAEEDAENESDNALIDAMLEHMTAEIPDIMFERRIDDIVREWTARNRISVQDYVRYTGSTIEQFRDGFRPVAERQVKIRLALEKIAVMENVEVTAEDIEKEYNELAEQYSMELDRVKAAIPEDTLKEDIKIEKALDIVKDSAKIN